MFSFRETPRSPRPFRQQPSGQTGEPAAQIGIDIVENGEHPGQQHHQHRQHDEQEDGGIQENGAQTAVQTGTVFVVRRQRGKGLFGAAGALSYGEQAADVVRETSGVPDGLRQGAALVGLPGHAVQYGAEGGGDVLVRQQGQAVSQGDACVKQEGQGLAQAAELVVGQAVCFHKTPT